jgi:hypothetical protein
MQHCACTSGSWLCACSRAMSAAAVGAAAGVCIRALAKGFAAAAQKSCVARHASWLPHRQQAFRLRQHGPHTPARGGRAADRARPACADRPLAQREACERVRGCAVQHQPCTQRQPRMRWAVQRMWAPHDACACGCALYGACRAGAHPSPRAPPFGRVSARHRPRAPGRRPRARQQLRARSSGVTPRLRWPRLHSRRSRGKGARKVPKKRTPRLTLRGSLSMLCAASSCLVCFGVSARDVLGGVSTQSWQLARGPLFAHSPHRSSFRSRASVTHAAHSRVPLPPLSHGNVA